MKQSSVDALIHTCIIMGVIAGLPLLCGVLIIGLIELWTNTINIPIEWIRIEEDIAGGFSENELIFGGIYSLIMIILFSIGIYIESKQSIETKKEDKK